MIDAERIKLAVSLSQSGEFEKAEAIYMELSAEYGDDPFLMSAIGIFYVNIRNYDKAVIFLTRAYNIKKTFGIVSALGFAYYEVRDYTNASKFLEEALEYGKNADVFDKLISALFETRKYRDAIKYSNMMYDIYPNEIKSVSNQIKSLTTCGKLAEAEQMCIASIKANPNEIMLWFQLGYLKELIYCDDEKAMECYKHARDLGSKSAYYNMAVSCQKLGKKQDAERYYNKMSEYFPDDEETQISLGMCLLSQKKFKEGYELFYKRDSGRIGRYTKNLYRPGSKIPEELIVVCDQGFGDHIQFIRYLPLVPAKKIKIACPDTLKKIFKTNYNQYEFISYNEIPNDVQVIRVSDLAYVLGLDFDNIPFSEGYLDVSEKEIENDKLKVGLCWEAGSAGIRTMINRTVNIKCFESFFDIDNIQLYSFQYDDTLKGCEKYPQMINLAKDFKDFFDTASAIKAMDVVVSVDTSVAHLAGALGVKTYLLLPYAPDWRWFDDTATTPWYKSVEIFKQNHAISWEKPLKDIMVKLRNFS